MNKHTPGPWNTTRPLTMDKHALPIGEDTRVVATDYAVAVLSTFKCTPEEVWANARLMAAAPELLSALEALLADESRLAMVPHADVERGRLALRKARGGE